MIYRVWVDLLTVLDLLQLHLIQVSAPGVAQRIKGTAGVLPLLSVRLATPLRLSEGQSEKLHGQDEGEGAPGNGVAEVSGLAVGSGCPLLSRHPVAVA